MIDFFKKYVTEDKFNELVDSGKISYLVLMSYKHIPNRTPNPTNLVILCKFLANNNKDREDELLLEALDMILN